MKPQRHIAVIGVGNDFRHDDGIGWAVLQRLRDRAAERPMPPGTELETCDGDPVRLIERWEHADLAVVIDAAHAHPGHPGRVHRLELDSERLDRPASASSHGLGLGEAVELSRVLGRLPARLVLYAVEGADTSLGTGLSPAVEAVVEQVALSVEDEVERHCQGTAPLT